MGLRGRDGLGEGKDHDGTRAVGWGQANDRAHARTPPCLGAARALAASGVGQKLCLSWLKTLMETRSVPD